MGFFDLNIPYLEPSKPTQQNPSQKHTRIKLTIKAMELGYSGIAYNRTIKGVMSDNDCCTISPLSLSSLLKLAPSLSSSVKLHRDALGVPISSPFRQYTRLTVSVDSVAQATALNSGNPILRTYDLVAVRPMNQNAFTQACQVSEVDFIAIDFSENLPFRLKRPLVKAAIQRGIYFEMTYSNFIADVQMRRQMITNAKLLVEWTGGKNLIISSAAPSVTELRGPYDVANLMSLLGLSMERAKAAISKNCRTLIANALRKKLYYKEAIRVEPITSNEQKNSDEPWYCDWIRWDPISSGEGDLLLEDMAKSFAASSKVTKTVKAIDFASIVDSISSHGLQLKDLASGAKTVAVEVSVANDRVSENPSVDQTSAEVVESSVTANKVSEVPRTDQISLNGTPSVPHSSFSEHLLESFSPNNTMEDFSSVHEIETHTTTTDEGSKNSNGLDFYPPPTEKDMHDLEPQDSFGSREPIVISQDPEEAHQSTAMDVEFDASCCPDDLTPSRNQSAFQDEDHEKLRSCNAVLGAEDFAVNETSTEKYFNDPVKNIRDDEVLLADGRPFLNSFDEIKGKDNCSSAEHEQLKEVIMEEPEQEVLTETIMEERDQEARTVNMMEEREQDEARTVNMMEEREQEEAKYPASDKSTSGKGRGKLRAPRQPCMFPFKRLLNPIPFKKKSQKFRSKIKSI